MSQEKSILIVEDEFTIAADLGLILAEAGYQVIGVAPDSESAFALAEQRPPQFAVVDVGLASPVDGVSVADELTRIHGTRIVFVTANPGQIARYGPEKAKKVVAKPYRDHELLMAIAAL